MLQCVLLPLQLFLLPFYSLLVSLTNSPKTFLIFVWPCIISNDGKEESQLDATTVVSDKSNLAWHVLGNNFALLQELLTVCYVVPNNSITRSPTGNVLGTTYHKLYCTVKSSWRWAKLLPKTCRANCILITNLMH